MESFSRDCFDMAFASLSNVIAPRHRAHLLGSLSNRPVHGWIKATEERVLNFGKTQYSRKPLNKLFINNVSPIDSCDPMLGNDEINVPIEQELGRCGQDAQPAGI